MKVGSVLGHYHVVRTLGRGGMGAVYEANDTRLNRQVALKVLPARMASNPEWFKRFEREAQAVAALNHPNIVTIHSVEEADDVHFIILELVGGKTLDELIPDDGLPLDQFFDIAIPLTDAIAAAHKRGIAHRDLKPSNVMVDDEGRVKVLDFGIAKLVDEPPEDEVATQVGSEALTEEGKIVGTVAYMSPEQAEGKASDHRSDIFSLGIMLYEMATGDRPFVGDTKLSILAAIVKDTPEPIIERKMEVPRHLQRIVKKALEKNLNRRYQSMVELRNDLVELKEEIDAGVPLITGGTLTDPGAMDAYRAPPEASPWGKWVGAAGVAVAVAALAWTFWGPRETPQVVATEATPALTVTQLTTTSGEDFAGTISPDGEWFVFVRRNGAGPTLYLQSIGSRTPIPLDTVGLSPAFSPSGDRIAYSGPPESSNELRSGGGIYVMGRTGDDRRNLTEQGFNPAWSPDGTRIVYSGEYVESNPYSRLGNADLHIVDVATGQRATLEVQDGVQPNWSPGGHRIAYWGADIGQRDIWTISPEGGDPIPVTRDEAVDSSPVWSPDGRWIYWTSTRGGTMAIWRVPIDEETGEVLGDAQQINTGGSTEPAMLSFSADGNKILYTEVLTRGRVSAAGFDPEALRLTSDPVAVIEGSRRIQQAEISPDGTRLVYRTGGARQDLFVAPVDGGDEQQITDDLAKDWAPRWSPDSQSIVYYSNKTTTYEVWTVNRDGTRPVQRTQTPDDNPLRPIYSPDGAQIIFGVRDKASRLIDARLTFEDQVMTELPLVPGRELSGFLTSDWRDGAPTIVGEADGIYTYDFETQEYEQLFDGEGLQPYWLADGRRVIFRTPNPPSVFVVDRITKEIWQIEDAPQAEGIFLAPDNLSMYLVQQESQSDIWVASLGAGGQ